MALEKGKKGPRSRISLSGACIRGGLTPQKRDPGPIHCRLTFTTPGDFRGDARHQKKKKKKFVKKKRDNIVKKQGDFPQDSIRGERNVHCTHQQNQTEEGRAV